MTQFDLFLPGGGPKVPPLGDCELIPAGPYRVSMLWDAIFNRYTPPYRIVAGEDGQTIAGFIDNLAVAVRLAELLNAHGAGDADRQADLLNQRGAP